MQGATYPKGNASHHKYLNDRPKQLLLAMQILICSATVNEIIPTIDFLASRELSDHVDILITGVGLTAATYSITKAVSQKRPMLLIQAGIGGSLSGEQPLAETVIIQKDTIGDLGVEEKNGFLSVFDMKLVSKDQEPWKEGWLVNPHSQLLKEAGLPLVTGLTVNEVSTNHARISYYHQLGGQVESMEGAALHYVALKENIPFLQLRSLSNFIGERDKSKWEMDRSIIALNHSLQHLIIKMVKK